MGEIAQFPGSQLRATGEVQAKANSRFLTAVRHNSATGFGMTGFAVDRMLPSDENGRDVTGITPKNLGLIPLSIGIEGQRSGRAG
jgi:hypothetical protein